MQILVISRVRCLWITDDKPFHKAFEIRTVVKLNGKRVCSVWKFALHALPHCEKQNGEEKIYEA